MRLTVVLPTLNEAENLRPMIEELLALDVPECELSVLIADNDSPDGTGDLADELSREHAGRVDVLHLGDLGGRRGGLGTAYVAAFGRALGCGADLVVQMDCDFSHPPACIPRMLEVLAREGADMVLGSRYARGGRLGEDWPWWRRLLSRFANALYVNVLLDVPLKDATGGFRLWRRETLLGMDVAGRIRSEGYVFQVETASLAHRLGYRIVETPIAFPQRRAGESKMNLAIQLEAAWRVFDVRWRHRRLRPVDRAPLPARRVDERPPASRPWHARTAHADVESVS